MGDAGAAQIDDTRESAIQRQKVGQAGIAMRKALDIGRRGQVVKLFQNVCRRAAQIFFIEIILIDLAGFDQIPGLLQPQRPCRGKLAVVYGQTVDEVKALSYASDGFLNGDLSQVDARQQRH
jgi:hypothetical protein